MAHLRSRLRGKSRAPGYSLPLVLLFAVLLLTLNLSDCYRVQHELSARSSRERNLRAEYAARAGLNRAVAQLSRDPHWHPTSFTGAMAHDPSVTYKVEVANNYGVPTDTTAPDGSLLPAGRVWLNATGLVNGVAMKGSLGQAKAIPLRPLPVFDCVIDEVSALYLGTLPNYPNTVIDSYSGVVPRAYTPYLVPGNPSTYRNQAVVHSADLVTVQDSGFVDARIVASDSTKVSAVDVTRVSGAVTVDAAWGPYWKFRIPAALESQPLQSAPSGGLVAPGRYASMVVPPGGQVELRGGLYFFDRIELGAGSRLVLDSAISAAAPCEVYLGARFEVGANSEVNLDHAPRCLQIYTTDQDNGRTTITCQADSRISATLAGYGAYLLFTRNVEFFGAFKVYDFGEGEETRIHYDADLNGQVLDGDPDWALVDESSS